MRFLSLTRLPKNKRFNFQPRYYDPIKEEIEERTSRIKSELDPSESHNYRENISTAFQRRSRREKKSGLMQFSFVIIFSLILFGYIYFGEAILYVLLVFIPFYIWIKLRRKG